METIKLGVYRRLDDRMNNLPNESPEALERHNRRKDALHEVFDHQDFAQVEDWGMTDDNTPHEYVEIVFGVIATVVVKPFISAALKELGMKLLEKGIDEAASTFVKWIISKLIRKQKDKKIQDFNIMLKGNISVQVNPPDWTSDITIAYPNGKVTKIKYDVEDV